MRVVPLASALHCREALINISVSVYSIGQRMSYPLCYDVSMERSVLSKDETNRQGTVKFNGTAKPALAALSVHRHSPLLQCLAAI
jgi:hypothetical protein